MNNSNREVQRTKWHAALFGGVVMAVCIFALSTIIGYIQIGRPADGSIMQPSLYGSFVVCLVGAFAGMLSVWYYTRYVASSLSLGRGALIGILTSIVVICGENLLALAWNIIDPDYTKQVMKSLIANIEAMEIPDDIKQQQIDMIAQQYRQVQSIGGFLQNVLLGLPFYGILNIVTAMIGVKVYGAEKEVENGQ